MEQRISLNGLWRFSTDPSNMGIEQQWMVQENQPYIESKTREVIPSCWNRRSSKENGQDHTIGWYWRVFRIPERFLGHTIFLRVNGVVYNATIFIDAQEVGQFNGGFLPFDLNVTAFADLKEHFLAIRIDGTDAENRYPSGTIINPYNGIIGEVELIAIEKLIMEDWSYTTKLIFKDNKTVNYAELEFSIYLKNTADQDFKGVVEISLSKDFVPRASVKKDVEVLKQNSRLMKILIHIDQPELWSPEDPTVMGAHIHVYNDKFNAVDFTEIMGIREVKLENNQLFLNGKPQELKGYDFEIDQPDFGYCLPETMIIDKLNKLKEININIIRPNQGVFPPIIVEMASRLGFMVIQDIPIADLSLAERDNFYRILIEKIKPFPGLIFYSFSNRVDTMNPRIEGQINNIKQLINQKLDATHLFVPKGYLNAKSWIRNEAEGFKDILK